MSSIVRPGSRTDFTYDAGSLLSEIQHTSGANIRSSNKYAYDQRKFISQKRTLSGTFDYSYDLNGQLTSSLQSLPSGLSEQFGYDSVGNRTSSGGAANVYDANSEKILDDGMYTYVFDNNWNVTYKSSKSSGISYAYSYNSRNELKIVSIMDAPLSGNLLRKIEYKYDPLGRRIERKVTDIEHPNDSYQKFFAYDGDNIVAEMDANNRVLASYTFSPMGPDDVLAVHFTSHAVPAAQGGDPISSKYIMATSVGNFYYLKDHLNTVTDVIDSNGTVVQKHEFFSYGSLRSVKNSAGADVTWDLAPIKSTFLFAGREYEPETGLYYNRARYYDPTTGRFLQKDSDPGDITKPAAVVNKYIYGSNNPIMMMDPSGRFGIFAAMLVGAAVGAVVGAIDATLNGGNFLEKTLKGAVGGALFGAAIYLNPTAGLLSLGTSIAKASSKRENFFSAFNADIIKDGAIAATLSVTDNYLNQWAGSANIVEGIIPKVALGVIQQATYFVGIPYITYDFLDTSCKTGNGGLARNDVCQAFRHAKGW